MGIDFSFGVIKCPKIDYTNGCTTIVNILKRFGLYIYIADLCHI